MFSDIKERFSRIALCLSNATRPFRVVNKLGEAQFIYWDLLSDGFIDTILNSKDINKSLLEYCQKDNYAKINKTIQKCSKHVLMINYKRLFFQTISAYRNKKYDLSAVGLLAIIDGLLSDVSEKTTTDINRRVDTILEKIELHDIVDNDDVAVLTLVGTLMKTRESLSASYPFSGNEPALLNRHWIMHGRSHKRKTQLDCIKLINFIYGIILIHEVARS